MSGSDCGANAPGGGGFQPGNDCASEGGSSPEKSVSPAKEISSAELRAMRKRWEEESVPLPEKLKEVNDLFKKHPDQIDRIYDSARIGTDDQKEINQLARAHYEAATGEKLPEGIKELQKLARKIGAPVVVTKAKEAASEIADRLVEIYEYKLESNQREDSDDYGRIERYESALSELRGDDPKENRDSVEENWHKSFRRRDWFLDVNDKRNGGVTTAFAKLSKDDIEYVQMAAIASHQQGSEWHRKLTERFPNIVAFYRPERIVNKGIPAGIYRVITHIPMGPMNQREKLTATAPIDVWISGGSGGTQRHEYGHAVHDLVSEKKEREWRKRFAENVERVGTDISKYAQTNEMEYFAETYTLATDPRYKPENHTDFANESVKIVKEWISDVLLRE